MKVFSIILRILSLGACGFAANVERRIRCTKRGNHSGARIDFWILPKVECSARATQDETVKSQLRKIRERDPNDASLTRLEEIKTDWHNKMTN